MHAPGHRYSICKGYNRHSRAKQWASITKRRYHMWGAKMSEWGSGFCGFGPSFGHGPWFLGWLFPLLFWGLIAYLIFRSFRYLFSGRRSGETDSSFEILRNRYAAGDINEQEYTEQKAILGRK